MLVLVRLAPEINLKSRPVKTRFVQTLINNIHSALRSTGHTYKIEKQWNRLFVDLEDPEDIGVLSKVFGISSLSPVEYSCDSTLEAMTKVAKNHYQSRVAGKSFAIKAKRRETHCFTSKEIENTLGACLAPHARRVDLTNPEIKIEVEARSEQAIFFQKRIPCPGGLPLTTEGRALCLLSGGFDSAVAAWQMMKRGVSVDFVFCSLAGKSYTKSVVSVARRLTKLWAWGYEPKIYILDFNEIRQSILKNARNQYAQVLLKRAMLHACNELTRRHNKWHALVTGECIGQVSSQTLHNLAVIDRVAELPVLRPLVTFDKEDIIAMSRQIGVYALSAPIKEHCALVAKKPITQGKLVAVEKQESFLDAQDPYRAVEECEIINLSNVDPMSLFDEYAYCDTIPDQATVVDCRSKDEYDDWHFPDAVHMDLNLLTQSYKHFSKDNIYVLCCDIGVQTAVVAEKMQDAGLEAYSFRGGIPSLKKYLEKEKAKASM